MMTCVTATKPPAPTPWIVLPISIRVKDLVTAQRMEPTAKTNKAVSMTGRRPKTWLNATQMSMSAVEARRKDVPAQKASVADP